MTAIDIVTTEGVNLRPALVGEGMCAHFMETDFKVREDITLQEHQLQIPTDGEWYVHDESRTAIRVCYVTAARVGIHSVKMD